jgi:hypothetical protein
MTMAEFAAAGGAAPEIAGAVGKASEMLSEVVSQTFESLNTSLTGNRVFTFGFPQGSINFSDTSFGDIYNFKWELDHIVDVETGYASHVRFTASTLKDEHRLAMLGAMANLPPEALAELVKDRDSKLATGAKWTFTPFVALPEWVANHVKQGKVKDALDEATAKVTEETKARLTKRFEKRLKTIYTSVLQPCINAYTWKEGGEQQLKNYFNGLEVAYGVKAEELYNHYNDKALVAGWAHDGHAHLPFGDHVDHATPAGRIAAAVAAKQAGHDFEKANNKAVIKKTLEMIQSHQPDGHKDPEKAKQEIAKYTSAVYSSSGVRSASVAFHVVYEVTRISHEDIKWRWQDLKNKLLERTGQQQQAAADLARKAQKNLKAAKETKADLHAAIASITDPSAKAKDGSDKVDAIVKATGVEKTVLAQISAAMNELMDASQAQRDAAKLYETDRKRMLKAKANIEELANKGLRRIGRVAIYPVGAISGGLKTDIRFRNTNASFSVSPTGRPDGSVAIVMNWSEESKADAPFIKGLLGNVYSDIGTIILRPEETEPTAAGKIGSRVSQLWKAEIVNQAPAQKQLTLSVSELSAKTDRLTVDKLTNV